MLNRIEKNVTKDVLGSGFPCSCGCFGQLRDGSVDCRQKHPVGPSSGPDASSQPLSVGFGGPAPVWGVGRAVGWDMGSQGAAFHTLLPLVGFCPLPQGCLWSNTTLEKEFPLGDVPVAITVVSEFFMDVIFG